MTRQQKAREALISEGFNSARDISSRHLGKNHERNREIVQACIFDGQTLQSVGDRFGLSREQVRNISLGTTRRAIGRYAGKKETS